VILKKLRQKVRDYCENSYPKELEVYSNNSIAPAYNNSCHYNADACVRQGHAVAIVECVMIHDGRACLHYISLDSGLKCFDSTLGPLYSGADYRMIEVLRDFPNSDPGERLNSKKREICLKAGVPKWLLSVYSTDDLL